jgi:hypothetical protein
MARVWKINNSRRCVLRCVLVLTSSKLQSEFSTTSLHNHWFGNHVAMLRVSAGLSGSLLAVAGIVSLP